MSATNQNKIERTIYVNKYVPVEPVYYVCYSNQQVLKLYIPDLYYDDALTIVTYGLKNPNGKIIDSSISKAYRMDNGGTYVYAQFSRGAVKVGENLIQLCFSYQYTTSSGTLAYSDVFTIPFTIIGVEQFATPGWSTSS